MFDASNNLWLWLMGVLFIAAIYFSYRRYSQWLQFLGALSILACMFAFIAPSFQNEMRLSGLYRTECSSSGGSIITVNADEGGYLWKCVKPDYIIPIQSEKQQCDSQGGNYMVDRDKGWQCIKKDHLIDINVK